jgi:hypothetical protein
VCRLEQARTDDGDQCVKRLFHRNLSNSNVPEEKFLIGVKHKCHPGVGRHLCVG